MKMNTSCIRKHLKKNLLTDISVVVYEAEYKQLVQTIMMTVAHGVSNSALLIGPNGSGKTTLVNQVLKRFQDDGKLFRDFTLVQLNGLIHTNDRLALEGLALQLNLENVVEGKVFGSFAENLSFLLGCLKTGKRQTTKAVVIVLEEFDLFCSHNNQTLLYNLFDVAQSAQTPLCVLGVTCRMDVIELLEKRVKSRYSHRQVYLFPGGGRGDKSDLELCLKAVERYLKLPDDLADIDNVMKTAWNYNVEALLRKKEFLSIIGTLVGVHNKESDIKLFLLPVVIDMKDTDLTLPIEKFQQQLDLMLTDETSLILQDLSVLQLCLIIAMKHHNHIYDNQPLNFEMIYSRFIKFANANACIQTAQKAVVTKAFEQIESLGLIGPIGNDTKVQKEFRFYKLLVMPFHIDDAVKKYCGLPTEVVQWANSSLA